MKFKAVIFDMDGVLVDTERYYVERREEFFGTHRIDISHLKNSDFIGSTMRDLWQRVLRENYSVELSEKLGQEYLEFKDKNPIPYKELLFPEVKETLDYLSKEKYTIALASSSSMAEIEECLKVNQIKSYFDELLSGTNFKASKPHPEIYLETMKRLRVKDLESLIIEDSQNGIAAGKDAGATVWAIKDYRFGMNQERADLSIDNLSSVVEKFQNMKH